MATNINMDNRHQPTGSSSSETPSLAALRKDFVAMFNSNNRDDALYSTRRTTKRPKYTNENESPMQTPTLSVLSDRKLERKRKYGTPEVKDLENGKRGEGVLSGVVGGSGIVFEEVKNAAKVVLYQASMDSPIVGKHMKLLRNLKANTASADAWIELVDNLNEERKRQCNFRKASDQVVKDMRSAIIKVYTKAIDVIPMTLQNRHSPAYLKLWTDRALSIAEGDDKDKEAAQGEFQKMKASRIGLNFPQLYECWAQLEGLCGRIHMKEIRLKESALLRSRLHKSSDPNTPRTPLPNSLPSGSSAVRSATKRMRTPRSGLPMRPPRRVPVDGQVTSTSSSLSTPLSTTPVSRALKNDAHFSDSPEVFRSAKVAPKSTPVDFDLKENIRTNTNVYQEQTPRAIPLQVKSQVYDAYPPRKQTPIERRTNQKVKSTPTSTPTDSQDGNKKAGLSHPSTPSYLNSALEGTLSKFDIRGHAVSSKSPYSEMSENYRGKATGSRGEPKVSPTAISGTSGSPNYREANPKPRTTRRHKDQFESRRIEKHSSERKRRREKEISPGKTPGREAYASHEIMTVNGKKYMKLDTVGRGGSSEVYKILSLANNKIYALKKVDIAGASHAAFESYKNEIDLLRKLSGKPTIIELIDWEICKAKRSIFLVLEYGEIDLAQILQRSKGTSHHSHRESYRQAFYWQQMLEAVNTIHQNKIFHGDLKPANFLLVKDTLKLIDFGIAKAIVNEDTTKIIRNAAIGTPNYMSPEALREEQFPEDGDSSAGDSSNGEDYHRRSGQYKVSRLSDIWSLGCILYQMTYGKAPFAHIKNLNQKMQCIMDPNYKIKYKDVHDDNLLQVLQGCLQRDPAKRMTMDELREHPYVRPNAVPAVQESNRHTIERVLEVLQEMNIQVSPESLAARIGDGTQEILKKVTYSESRKAIHFPDRLPGGGGRGGTSGLTKSKPAGHPNAYRTPTSSWLTNSEELRRET